MGGPGPLPFRQQGRGHLPPPSIRIGQPVFWRWEDCGWLHICRGRTPCRATFAALLGCSSPSAAFSGQRLGEAREVGQGLPAGRERAPNFIILLAAPAGTGSIYDQLGVVYFSSIELFQSELSNDEHSNMYLHLQPIQGRILEAITEGYAGVVVGVTYALAHRGLAQIQTPPPEPSYVLGYLCRLGSSKQRGGDTCENITFTTPGSRGRLDISRHDDLLDVVLERLLKACGTFCAHGQHVEVDEGVPFGEYCNVSCGWNTSRAFLAH